MLRSLGLVGLAGLGTFVGLAFGVVLGVGSAVGTDSGDWVLRVGEPVVVSRDGVTATVQQQRMRRGRRTESWSVVTLQADGRPDVGVAWRADEAGAVVLEEGTAVWTVPGAREARVGWE